MIWRVLLIAALASGAVAWAQDDSTHTIVIKQMRFNPSVLKVRIGDTVEWKNDDIFAHTATADDKTFDSGLLQPGQSWTTTFTKAGSVSYHCTPHPNMKATIAVAAVGASGDMVQQQDSLRLRIPNSPEELHPILVNFTAALLPLALLSDLLGLAYKKQSLHTAAAWMVVYEAILTPLTVAAGWWWRHAVGSELPHRLITVHQWLGSAAGVLFIVIALWRWTIHKRGASPGIAYLALAGLAVFALIYQGSIGGAMVFGK